MKAGRRACWVFARLDQSVLGKGREEGRGKGGEGGGRGEGGEERQLTAFDGEKLDGF